MQGEDFGVGEGEALAPRAGHQEEGPHACGLADAVGRYVAFYKLHAYCMNNTETKTGTDQTANSPGGRILRAGCGFRSPGGSEQDRCG